MSAWKMLAREVSRRRRKTEEAEGHSQEKGGDQERHGCYGQGF